MKFSELKPAQKFSTMVGQYIKLTETSYAGFRAGEFVFFGLPFEQKDEEIVIDGIIPCDMATYFELVAINHCVEIQDILGDQDGKADEFPPSFFS